MLGAIKRAATEAVDAAKPFALTYGTVKTASPLTITVDQKLELGPPQLLLTNNVREYTVDMTVDHWTEDETAHTHPVQDTYTGGGSSSPTTHRHAYKGRKTFTVHLGLKAGEKVLLLRIQGGQQYIVLDRVEAP
jgi:hypothetical protein